MEFRHPSPLKPGDKVAIVSPSAGLPFLFPWVYEQGIQQLKEVFQLQPVEFPSARQSPEFLSQNPKARAEDINQAFADPSIKGIIATIGGNDQIRILPYLNKHVIAANPKVFMGYSDCTNLHLFLWNLGIVSYYGGSIMVQFAMGGGMQKYTVEAIRKAIFNPPIGEVKSALEYSDADLDWADKENLKRKRDTSPSQGWVWHNMPNGVISRRLWGGCVEILDLHLSVKRYFPHPDQLKDTVLFMETSEEMPPEGFVYRFIAALGELGILNKLKAILVGYPKAQFFGMQPPEGREEYIANQQNGIVTALKDYDSHIPVVFNMNFGHTDPQLIIPNGSMVTLDGIKKIISFN